jgi:DNA helicase II / ATP-dependent DNA helicase PcrA
MMPGTLNLSEEQQKVVAHRGRHLQVVACAGSGKTETVSQRVASLILEGTPPAGIVAFTFTERAAASLKFRILQRVADKMGDDALDLLSPMFVGTIHSYGFRLLQDHVPEYADFELLDDHRLTGLLCREHKNLGLTQLHGGVFASIAVFQRHLDAVENELISAEALVGTDFGDIYVRFCEMLHRYHFLTFGQMISAAVEALERPEVFEAVHGKLRHLIVDEYQDINPAQERLIGLLGQRPVKLCVVGDDDQAIYQWRGSTVENIQTFVKRYRAKARTLLTNYRSRPGIIEVANEFAETIEPVRRRAKPMLPHRNVNQPAVQAWSAETPDDEAKVIADTITGLRSRGYRFRDMAILLRSVTTSGASIVRALQDKGIPVRCGGRAGLFQQPEIQALGMMYAWLSDNSWQLEPSQASDKIDIESLVACLATAFGARRPTVDKLRRHLLAWQGRVDDETPANLVRDYYSLLRLLGVQRWNLEDPLAASRMGTLARFSQILADFEHVRRRARWVDDGTSSDFKAGQDRGIWYYRHLFNYLQFYARNAYQDFEGEESFELDAVDVLTVHQAKGLEWPVVFVPCLVKGRFPSSKTGQKETWLLPESVFPAAWQERYAGTMDDERRLFYVAMTRAKDMLYLSRFRRKKNCAQPSPFLEDAAGSDPPLVLSVTLPPRCVPDRNGTSAKLTLTFSDLAHYEHCPLAFRISGLLGFQPQLVPELGYGKAIHHALRRIADHVRATGEAPTQQEVDRLLDAEFYLPYAHSYLYKRLHAEARKVIGRYLADYRDDLFRVWETERPFELHLDQAIVTGRADVILDREGDEIGSLALVDYKTAADPRTNDIYAFQLAIYAAAGRGEGLNVRAAYVHDLKEGDRLAVPIAERKTEAAKRRANKLAKAISERRFEAQPDKQKCRGCDYRLVCRHGPAERLT